VPGEGAGRLDDLLGASAPGQPAQVHHPGVVGRASGPPGDRGEGGGVQAAGEAPGGRAVQDDGHPAGRDEAELVVVQQHQVGVRGLLGECAPGVAQRAEAVGQAGQVHRGELLPGNDVVRPERGEIGDVMAAVEQGPDLPMQDPGVLGMATYRADTDPHTTTPEFTGHSLAS